MHKSYQQQNTHIIKQIVKNNLKKHVCSEFQQILFDNINN